MMTNKFPFEHFFQNGSGRPNQPPNLTDQMLNHQPPAWGANELQVLNQGVLNTLQEQIGPEKFDTLFQGNLKLVNVTQNEVHFQAPSPLIKEMVESQYKDQVAASVQKALGKPYQIVVNTEAKGASAAQAKFTIDLNLKETKEDLISTVESQYLKHIQETESSISIDPNKTFDNFIVGSSNNLAFATAYAVAESPGKEGKYPCLYIYSDSGLGKTHLLHAVANGIKKNHLQKAVYLISAREFMKELINAFRDKNLNEFQKKYCENIDVLMIDDIHELKNKQSTQEEFFHIFNELHAQGKQLIFTSDKAPKEIDGIKERIVTRLQWGLVIDIQKPDLETRIAILKKKALELDFFVPDDVLTLIASSIKTSIRELEGSLIKLSASSDVMGMEIDIEIARELLKLTPSEDTQAVSLENIAKAVSQYYKIPLGDLCSRSRNKNIVQARHTAWYLSKKLINATLKDIARYYGGRDHSSITHGINNVMRLAPRDPSFEKDLSYLETNI